MAFEVRRIIGVPFVSVANERLGLGSSSTFAERIAEVVTEWMHISPIPLRLSLHPINRSTIPILRPFGLQAWYIEPGCPLFPFDSHSTFIDARNHCKLLFVRWSIPLSEGSVINSLLQLISHSGLWPILSWTTLVLHILPISVPTILQLLVLLKKQLLFSSFL